MKEVARSTDGNPVHFDVDGEGARALVLIHGWACDRSYWTAQMDLLAGRYRMVALDLAGHGESGADRETWTMVAFGEDVVAVVEKLDLGDLVLVGHSMGGDVAVEAAIRLGDRVAGLIWVDTYTTLGESRTREEVEEYLGPFSQDFSAATRDMVRRMFVPGSHPGLVDWVAADMSAAPPQIAIDAMRHSLTNHDAVLSGLRQIAAPVVAINADDVPTDIQALGRHGVGVVLMSGVGHFLMMEDPLTFNRLLAETIAGFG